jgi:hypothetical protein
MIVSLPIIFLSKSSGYEAVWVRVGKWLSGRLKYICILVFLGRVFIEGFIT